jgi:hypothetical protein
MQAEPRGERPRNCGRDWLIGHYWPFPPGEHRLVKGREWQKMAARASCTMELENFAVKFGSSSGRHERPDFLAEQSFEY